MQQAQHFAHLPALPAFEPVVIDPRQMNRSAGHLEFSNILGAGRVKVIRAKSAPAGATLFAPLSRATPMISKISQVSWLGLEMPHSRIPLVVSQIPARYSKLVVQPCWCCLFCARARVKYWGRMYVRGGLVNAVTLSPSGPISLYKLCTLNSRVSPAQDSGSQKLQRSCENPHFHTSGSATP